MAKDPGIGKLITEPNPQRDAIHVAVAPTVAGCDLLPGVHVCLIVDRAIPAAANPRLTAVGIVDPFLKQHVPMGERFWLFLYPGTITTLRHHWEHPAFPAHAVNSVAESRRWLDEFASTFYKYHSAEDGPQPTVTGGELLEAMRGMVHGSGRDYVQLDNDIPDRAYKWAPEMWKHYEIITGERVPENLKKDSPFSCAC